MGLTATFFVSRPELASTFDLGVDWDTDAYVDFMRLTTGNLTCLLAAARGVDPDELDDDIEFLQIHEGAEDGPWIFRFPPDLEDFLALCSDVDIGKLTGQWRAVDEDLNQVDPRTRVEIVTQLVRLAKLADRNKQSLYLYNAL